MSNDTAPHVPSNKTIVRVCVYLATVVALGVSFSYSLELMNEFFPVGALWTVANVGLSLAFVRHIAVTHFLNQNS